MIARRPVRLATALVLVGGACASDGQQITLEDPITTPTVPTVSASAPSEQLVPTVVVDVAQAGDEISPLILGVSGEADAEYLGSAGITLLSWGGETATRYNHVIGASNGGRDSDYQNQQVGSTGDAVAALLAAAAGAGVASRIAVPTLGWVAKNGEPSVCSFPLVAGGCGTADDADCAHPGVVADPATTSVASTARGVSSWIAGFVADPSTTPRFIAFDNEPELWGITHYDLHPTCPTYEEILLKYLEYAVAIRGVAPDAELMGPVMCCWFDYWRTAPGPADGSGEDFLGWFLRHVHDHDVANGVRTLDVLDVRYYPQGDVVNDLVDAETAARRLRSTRSLYDPLYTDESWASVRIRLLPRLRHAVETSYPGTGIAISEWNWGADGTMNGALAIADVLGIYGREGVYLASYWERPAAGSPGYQAFRIHGNYDGQGGRFGGQSIPAVVDGLDPPEDLGAFAAYDPSTKMLRLMLINKLPETPIDLALDIRSLDPATTGRVFRYGRDDLDAITEHELSLGDNPSIELPPYSITLVEVPAAT